MPAARRTIFLAASMLFGASQLRAAQPQLESIRFKDKFSLLFPSGYEVRLDSDRVSPGVIYSNSWDKLHRIDARVCRPDQQEKQFSMEKIFWASGIGVDEVVKKEQLPNGDFLLTGKKDHKATAVYFNKGARGYLQVTVEGPDSLDAFLARIARSLKSTERKSSAQQALPLKLAEYVYEKDSVRLLVPDGARSDTSAVGAFWLPIDELDNIRVYNMSGFDYPYDETGKWLGAASDEREVAGNKIVNFAVHVLQFKPKGNKQEFYCYLGKEHENKIVISGPREYTDVMKLMAESAGVRTRSAAAPAVASPAPVTAPIAASPAAAPAAAAVTPAPAPIRQAASPAQP